MILSIVIRPANIYINESGDLKIGDFGLATLCNYNYNCDTTNINSSYKNNNMSYDIGTPLYVAPEQEKSNSYNNKADVYALGIILFELICNFKTFHEKTSAIIALRNKRIIKDKLLSDYEFESNLILLLTEPNPDSRPFSSDVKSMEPFIKWKEEIKYILNKK